MFFFFLNDETNMLQPKPPCVLIQSPFDLYVFNPHEVGSIKIATQMKYDAEGGRGAVVREILDLSNTSVIFYTIYSQ